MNVGVRCKVIGAMNWHYDTQCNVDHRPLIDYPEFSMSIRYHGLLPAYALLLANQSAMRK